MDGILVTNESTLTDFEGLSPEGVLALVGGGGGAGFLQGLGEGRWVATAMPVGGRRTSFSRCRFRGTGGGARGGI